ncbi:MAG: metal ABC transporter permease [Candidatus Heimdallarchaeota archaeon]|nr:metal ABC transporter permease [Candidatus Heimdallarchaeota archaeon]
MSKFVDFFQAFQYSFMQRALLASIIIALVCSIIGVFVLLKGMVFLGQAIAHSSFAGATLAILLGVQNPLLIIMGFSILSAVSIGYVNQKRLMRDEVIIGIVFSFFIALAALFIGLKKTYTSDIKSVLFGNLLTVDLEDFILLIIFSTLVLLILFLIKKELYFITFDQDLASIAGIPVISLNYLFLILVSITIAVSLKAIGAILVFTMIVTPAAAAYQWTFKLNRMIILSVVFAVLSSIFGLFISYMLDLASAASIAIIITAIFLISFLFSPKRKSTKRIGKECPFCKNLIDKNGSCENPNCQFGDIPHEHHDESVGINLLHLPEKEPTKHEHEEEEEE